MKKTLLFLGVAAVCAMQASFAGVEYNDSKSFKEKVVYEPEELCYFRDTEFQIDAFGAFVGAPLDGGYETSGNVLNTGVGGGGGFNVFFARYFGVGIEGLWYGNGGAAEHMFIGNFFVRYPICEWNLAPYIMAGGGVGFDHVTVGFGHVGPGIEYRITENIGVFTDTRWFYGAPDNALVTRGGIRLAF